MARNPFIKVALFERVATKLQDCKVVGQSDEYLILERPAVKPREKTAVKRSRKAKPVAVTTPVAAD